MPNNIDSMPQPIGELTLQTVPMPKDTNANGDIFGGWLVSQMDLAGGVAAAKIAKGRVATVAIDRMSFMIPVKVGSIVSCHTSILNIGRSSIEVQIEVWMDLLGENDKQKVTEGVFVFVALDDQGRTRAVKKK